MPAPDSEILPFIDKLTADVNAIALVVSELMAADCQKTANPSAHFQMLAEKIEEMLNKLPAGTDPQADQMAKWAKHRAEFNFIECTESLREWVGDDRVGGRDHL